MNSKRIAVLMVLALVLAVAAVAGCLGKKEAYPERPVTLLVAFGAGGTSDLAARAMADAAKKYFPQPLVVENKPGGAGTVGTAAGAQAKADGYTITLVQSGPIVYQPHRMDLPYGPDAFAYIGQFNETCQCVVARKDAPFANLSGFIAWAQQRKESVKCGHSGGVNQLGLVKLSSAAGLTVTEVPFDASAKAVAAVVGGHVDIAVADVEGALGQIRGGEVKVLAVFSKERVKFVPDAPTALEQGYDLQIGFWRGWAVPKGTPDAVVDRLGDLLKSICQDPQFVAKMEEMGMTVNYASGTELASRVEREYAEFGEIMKALGLAKK